MPFDTAGIVCGAALTGCPCGDGLDVGCLAVVARSVGCVCPVALGFVLLLAMAEKEIVGLLSMYGSGLDVGKWR